jgi:gas vesicle structural protein
MAVDHRPRISAIDVIDRILDKGIVIEYEARLSMVGVDLCTTVEARVVIASLDTYLRHAPAVRKTGRLLDHFPMEQRG